MKRKTLKAEPQVEVLPANYWSKLADRFHLPPLVERVDPVAEKLATPEGPKLKVVGKLGSHQPGPHVITPIPLKNHPKRWAAGDGKPQGAPRLTRGQIVFYQDLRYWVERVPASWSETCVVFISDEKVHPDVNRMNGDKRESFCVHADLLTEAPQVKLGAALPTVASAARMERAKAGVHDVGDEIAVLLRDCKDLEAVYAVAAKYLQVTVKALKEKYGHLNPGQQRMCCGNGMRYLWKQNNGLAGRRRK